MKLRQLIKAHFDTNGPTNMGRGIVDYVLNPELLQVYIEELNHCIEFGGSKIEIINEIKSGKPKRIITGHDEDGIPIYRMELSTVTMQDEPIVTVKLGAKIKFAPVIKIFSISLGPEIFDPNDIFKTKVNTVWLTPTIYDPETSIPTKRIVVTYSPDTAKDDALKSLRKEIREREKDETKPEFTIKLENDDKAARTEVIKEKETEVQNLMQEVNQDEIKNKIQAAEGEYLQTLVEMVQECFREPDKHILPVKRPILIRLTQDSLVNNDKDVISPDDTMVTLKQ